MPELPDIDVYVEALASRIVGRPIERAVLRNAFLLRTVSPRLEEVHGKRVIGVRRVGKRVVLALEDGLFLAIHLMIAGRLHWRGGGEKQQEKRLAHGCRLRQMSRASLGQGAR